MKGSLPLQANLGKLLSNCDFLSSAFSSEDNELSNMQCTQLLSRRPIIFGFLTLFILYLFFGVDHQAIRNRVPWTISSGALSTQEADVFDFPPVDSQAMRDLCSMQEWNSSLVFTCDNNHGGLGHIRNSILNCVRYAIGAGGALVLPSIAARGHDELDEPPQIERRHGIPRQGMEYMFDKNHFADSLRKSCPELNLIRHMEPVETPRRRGLLPENLFEDIPVTGLKKPEEWPTRLNKWIQKYMSHENQAEPIIIDFEQSFLHYPTITDGPEVSRIFGDILKFRPDTRRLATRTLMKMADWYDLPMNLSSPIINPSFFGAHLGLENPFQSADKKRHSDVTYSHYEAQSTAYLKQAFAAKTQIMYISSGDLEAVHKLGLEATTYNIAVTHKEDLLKGKDGMELERLNWDQRAIVDYLLLVKAQEFAGVGHSSFSWNIVLKREQSMGIDRGLGVGKLEEGKERWSDGLSTLYGVRRSYVESAGCMWP